MQFNHPTGYQINLLYLLCVFGKKWSHNKYAVLAFMSMLVDPIKYIREFSRYVVFSDGAPTQFKQKFTMCGMTLLQQSLSWNFFATSHRKGAVVGNINIEKNI